MQKILIPSLVLLGASLCAQESIPNPLIEVPGTKLQIRQWQEGGVPKSALSRDGGQTWTEQNQIDTLVHIRYGDFDPLDPPAVPTNLRAAADSRLFIVQFKTQIEPEFRFFLQYLGAELTYYLPSQSYLVRMDRDLSRKVEGLPFVRAVTPYHAAYRLEPEIIQGLGKSRGASTRYVIVLVDKRRDAGGVEGAVVAMDGLLNLKAEGGILLEATLDEKQLLKLANDDRVLWISRFSVPEYDIDNARIQGGANTLETVAGIDGKGISGHIVEGVYSTHPEFAARPPYRSTPKWLKTSSVSGHGTNTAGEIYARGANPLYKGLLPYAQMYYTHYSSYIFNKWTRYPLTKELVDPTLPYKCTIQTASWGYPRTLFYTDRSAEMDDIIFDFDLFVTQSQSNAGYSSQPRMSRPQAWAKNICSVGGFKHRNNSNAADDYWGKTGSTGPASDGRIGVTLSAYYDYIGTTSGSSSYTTRFGGTSGATPIINGYGGLVIQMFSDGLFGYPRAPSWNVRFGYKPHFSTTKALLVATAKQLTYNSSGVTIGANRYQQGFGFPDLATAYNERDRMLVIDELDVLQQGQERIYYLWVPPGTNEFHAALQYPDPPAGSPFTIHRVNSVDLSVKFSGGKFYWGNNGLLYGKYSVAGGFLNDRDTEESVIVAGPPPGLCEVKVRATGVRQDGHVETKAIDIDYALVVRGVGGLRDTTPTRMKLALVSTAPGNLLVSLTNLPAGWTQGFTLFSLATSRVASTGNALGLEADGLTLSLLASPPGAGNVFHFVPTPAKVYPNVTHFFPTALALALSGVTLDAVALTLNSSGGVSGASNVSRVKVQ